MKKFNVKYIRDFIEKRKEDIKMVQLGMWGDFDQTSKIVFDSGNYIYESNQDILEIIEEKGFFGDTSAIKIKYYWDLPVMRITYQSGKCEIMPCDTGNQLLDGKNKCVRFVCVDISEDRI